MHFSAAYWIERLQLTTHPEGGAYNRTYCSSVVIPSDQLPPAFHGDRPASTAIYFLLQAGEFSALHQIASDELWHFYYGDALTIYEIQPDGILATHLLGANPENGEQFQCVVKAGSWFGSAVKHGSNYALVGCTVAPGFDFADFRMGNRRALLDMYPQHATMIHSLTHP